MKIRPFYAALIICMCAYFVPAVSFANLSQHHMKSIAKIPEIPQTAQSHEEHDHEKMAHNAGMENQHGGTHNASMTNCKHKTGTCPHMAMAMKCHSSKQCAMIKNCSINDNPLTAPNIKEGHTSPYFVITDSAFPAVNENAKYYLSTLSIIKDIKYAPPERPPSI